MTFLVASFPAVAAVLAAAYLVGSIPWAYIVVKAKTGEDITEHGTGNVGSMNVRRSTGSWWLFALTLVADGLKGFLPVAVAKTALLAMPSWIVVPNGRLFATAHAASTVPFMAMAALAGAVIGHNYSLWMAIIERRFFRSGKGLATGAGALLAYDWRYFAAVLVVGLLTIAITRYMMAGQVAAAATLPLAAIALRSPDWPFALAVGAVVYAAHHRRFIGMLRGREPRLYVEDRMGPRG